MFKSGQWQYMIVEKYMNVLLSLTSGLKVMFVDCYSFIIINSQCGIFNMIFQDCISYGFIIMLDQISNSFI